MNSLNKFDSIDEIKAEILNSVHEKRNIKKAHINSLCNDEAQFDQALQELIDAGLVNCDGNFIYVD